jgi:hypothetical protein
MSPAWTQGHDAHLVKFGRRRRSKSADKWNEYIVADYRGDCREKEPYPDVGQRVDLLVSSGAWDIIAHYQSGSARLERRRLGAAIKAAQAYATTLGLPVPDDDEVINLVEMGVW